MKTTNSSLTLRGIIIGVLGLLLITVSSLYVALKLGALPWPTVFVTILSMTLLRNMKNSTLEEVTTTHTLMSAGSMVAGGLAFTLPGLWILDKNNTISFLSVTVATVVGALLGTMFTSIYRKSLIEEQKLPYPIGEAAYKTLITWKDKSSGLWLFPALGISAIFTFVRDFFKKIPSVVTFYKGGKYINPIAMYVSPMAISIGAIIGPKLALFWFLGMVIGYFILTPFGIMFGLFESIAVADSFRMNLGLGIMIGTGFAIAIKAIVSAIISFKKNKNRTIKFDKNKTTYIGSILLVSLLLIVFFTEVSVLECLLMFIGVAFATYLSSMLTGQTGINPMEIFALLIMLFISKICSTGTVPMFVIAVSSAVAAGLSGDVMNDFKSGLLVKTPFKDQVKAEAIGGVIGAITATAAIFVLKNAYVFGSSDMPSPQASLIANTVGGIDNPLAFWIGIIVGLVLFFIKVPSALVGLGMYLGTFITLSVSLGAIVKFIIDKVFKNSSDKSNLVASGLLGGEGFSGVVVALLTVLGV